ncbi:probable disease resistance protein At1g61190 [Mangifera indica]|uniref:probable disease resistance protein At1g61190 n=1 Tax=Mangifera indica TaxID=29780 RepID=UPI001CFAE3CC|nr:probable disease resistance protein At1g61190 [Mangifera indica]
MKKLKEQVKELRSRREGVEEDVKVAERQGEEIYNAVTEWLKDLEEFIERVTKLVEDEDKAKKRCFQGLCPDLIKRFRLSKEAEKVMEAGAKVLENGKFSRISHPPFLRRTESTFVGKEYKQFVSRDSNFQDVINALKDSTVNMIGVHGMGGVGKTTLVKKVAWKAREDKLLDEEVIAEVTQTPDLKQIQAALLVNWAWNLGTRRVYMEELINYVTGVQMFYAECEIVRLSSHRLRLQSFIFGVSALTVTSSSSLTAESVLPFFLFRLQRIHNLSPRKLIREATAFLLDVLKPNLPEHGFLQTKKNVSVEPLGADDARSLFENIVGDLSEKRHIAAEIVEKCAGLPLAIANALKGKSDSVWKDALLQLKSSNPRCVPEMDNTLYSTIELSYKRLNSEETESLLLLCALFNDT